VWSAKTRRFPSSRRGLCHAPPIGCKLSTNRKRKPKWRRCVVACIAVGPSAILTGSRTRPSDWGWNRRFGPMEDRRNNRRLATVTGGCHLFFLLYSPNLVAVSFPFFKSSRHLRSNRLMPMNGSLALGYTLENARRCVGPTRLIPAECSGELPWIVRIVVQCAARRCGTSQGGPGSTERPP